MCGQRRSEDFQSDEGVAAVDLVPAAICAAIASAGDASVKLRGNCTAFGSMPLQVVSRILAGRNKGLSHDFEQPPLRDATPKPNGGA